MISQEETFLFQFFGAWCPLKGHTYLNKPVAKSCSLSMYDILVETICQSVNSFKVSVPIIQKLNQYQSIRFYVMETLALKVQSSFQRERSSLSNFNIWYFLGTVDTTMSQKISARVVHMKMAK